MGFSLTNYLEEKFNEMKEEFQNFYDEVSGKKYYEKAKKEAFDYMVGVARDYDLVLPEDWGTFIEIIDIQASKYALATTDTGYEFGQDPIKFIFYDAEEKRGQASAIEYNQSPLAIDKFEKTWTTFSSTFDIGEYDKDKDKDKEERENSYYNIIFKSYYPFAAQGGYLSGSAGSASFSPSKAYNPNLNMLGIVQDTRIDDIIQKRTSRTLAGGFSFAQSMLDFGIPIKNIALEHELSFKAKYAFAKKKTEDYKDGVEALTKKLTTPDRIDELQALLLKKQKSYTEDYARYVSCAHLLTILQDYAKGKMMDFSFAKVVTTTKEVKTTSPIEEFLNAGKILNLKQVCAILVQMLDIKIDNFKLIADEGVFSKLCFKIGSDNIELISALGLSTQALIKEYIDIPYKKAQNMQEYMNISDFVFGNYPSANLALNEDFNGDGKGDVFDTNAFVDESGAGVSEGGVKKYIKNLDISRLLAESYVYLRGAGVKKALNFSEIAKNIEEIREKRVSFAIVAAQSEINTTQGQSAQQKPQNIVEYIFFTFPHTFKQKSIFSFIKAMNLAYKEEEIISSYLKSNNDLSALTLEWLHSSD